MVLLPEVRFWDTLEAKEMGFNSPQISPLTALPQPLPEDRAQHTVGPKKYFLMENCFPGFHAICLLSLCCEQKLEIHITDKEM